MPPTHRAVLFLAVCSACAGVSVRPEAVRADSLPVVALSADTERELGRHVDAAIEAVMRRHYAAAERQARQALDIDPRRARARAVLGMVLFQRSTLADPPDLFLAHAGEADLILAEQLAPADPFVGWMHAVMLAEAGHMTAAAATAEAALGRTEAAPANERAALLGVAGTYRYELGEERAALPHLQAYVALRPDDATARFRLGYCLLRLAGLPSGPKPNSLVVAQGQAEAAAAAFRRGAELVPGDEDVALAVGAALLRAAELAEQRRDTAARDDRRQQALQQFRAVADRFPGSAEALFRVGVVAEAGGEQQTAREAYTQALARDPEHLGSLLNLAAIAEHEAGAEDAVRELLRRAIAADGRRGALSVAERSRILARLEPPAGGATPP
ncbi:MAG: tetratricopeptide repeat protein [Planctomycetes bacterium]|nr:tetratricopeptide repeat protein [Planctomycetota bacterium]